jgi:nucleoid DNA-binding protein
LKAVNHQIWELIRHYLHKNSELCIANFGRFAAQSNYFSVDPIAKKITPSSQKIHFQPGVFENSKDFLKFYSEISSASIENNVDNLNKFFKDFKFELQKSNRIEVEYFGTFKFNSLGEIEFESQVNNPFLDSSFGLQPIQFAANLLKTKRIVVELPEEEDAALLEMRQSALKDLKLLLDNARISESNQSQKSTKAFPILASVLTLILFINLALFLYKGPVDTLKNQISQMNVFGNPSNILDSQKIENHKQEPVNVEVLAKESEIIIDEPVEIIESKSNEAEKVALSEQNLEAANSLVGEVAGAASIGRYMFKGTFEFDSSIYSMDVILLEPLEAQINNSVDKNLYTSNTSDKLITEKAKSVNIEKNNTSIEIPELPYIVNVEAQINDIGTGFYVIAGAFKIEANAINYRKSLVNNGDSEAVIIKPSRYPYYLVSYRKNESLNNALKQYNLKEKIDPSIWVYCAY